MLKTFAAVVLVVSTNLQGSILPEYWGRDGRKRKGEGRVRWEGGNLDYIDATVFMLLVLLFYCTIYFVHCILSHN